MIKQLFDLRWKRCSAGSRGRKAVGRNFGEDRQDRLEGKNIWGQVTPKFDNYQKLRKIFRPR